MYQDLGMRHDRPLKKSIVIFPIKMKGNSKRASGNSLSPLRPRTWILVLLTEVKLNLHNKLTMYKWQTMPVVWMRTTCAYLILTLRSLHSLVSWNAGYISQYLSTALWASTISMHMWQRAALKKYSLALYLSNELSIASAATCRF